MRLLLCVLLLSGCAFWEGMGETLSEKGPEAIKEAAEEGLSGNWIGAIAVGVTLLAAGTGAGLKKWLNAKAKETATEGSNPG